jgi:hypothetical protein
MELKWNYRHEQLQTIPGTLKEDMSNLIVEEEGMMVNGFD